MSWPTFWTKNNTWQGSLLKPLAGLVCFIAARRLQKFLQSPPAKQTKAKVVVVGNIVVGGTGKTPFILWLAGQLSQQNISYGIVSRGYGSKLKKEQTPFYIHPEQQANLSASEIGDEPYLLAQNLNCPLTISANRAEAVALLENKHDLEVIISDDGLQHYAMARDIEIVIFDGKRGIGNGQCLPAGPLRESTSRLKTVNWVVCNGSCEDKRVLEKVSTEPSMKPYIMTLEPVCFKRVNDSTVTLPLNAFQNTSVYAIAGIGNPQRFFHTLKKLEVQTQEKSFADHQNYQLSDFKWKQDEKPLLMTEKDAVKCHSFADDDWWYLEVQPSCKAELFERIIEKTRE